MWQAEADGSSVRSRSRGVAAVWRGAGLAAAMHEAAGSTAGLTRARHSLGDGAAMLRLHGIGFGIRCMWNRQARPLLSQTHQELGGRGVGDQLPIPTWLINVRVSCHGCTPCQYLKLGACAILANEPWSIQIQRLI